MNRLTTHVLDTVRGCGAGGLGVRLSRVGEDTAIAEMALDAGGRATLAERLPPGAYELLFRAGAYHRATGQAPDAPFLEEVPIRFEVVGEGGHYHVPLILSLFGYSTYRGA
jgi:5-hydroxyisourate hydrolase